MGGRPTRPRFVLLERPWVEACHARHPRGTGRRAPVLCRRGDESAPFRHGAWGVRVWVARRLRRAGAGKQRDGDTHGSRGHRLPDVDSHAYHHTRPDEYPHPYGGPIGNVDGHAYPLAPANGNPDAYADAGAFGDAFPHGNPHPHGDAHPHGSPHRNAHSECNAVTDRLAHTDGDADSDDHSHVDPDPDDNSDADVNPDANGHQYRNAYTGGVAKGAERSPTLAILCGSGWRQASSK